MFILSLNTPIDHKMFFATTCVIDFHAFLVRNFEHRVLRIEPTNVQWGAQEDWISIAIKNRRRERRELGRSLVTQDAAHKGFC